MKYADIPSFGPKREDPISSAVVCVHIALVLAPVYLAAIMGPGSHLALLWAWFGLGMNGLLNLMHECAHYHVFKDRGASLLLGRWVLGPLAWADFDGYQRRHWDHHRRLGESEDPKTIYRVKIRGTRLLALILRCLLLAEALERFRVQGPQPLAPAGQPLAPAGRILLGQAIFCGSLLLASIAFSPLGEDAISAAAWAYLGVYIYGLGALTTLAASLRAIAEHQLGKDGALTVSGAALRNFAVGPLALVLGPYGFSDHATHHEEPGLPYYRLKARTGELARKNPAFAPARGYASVLVGLIRGA